VGGLSLSAPPNAPSASINAICNRCWADQPLDEIEHAATEVLRGAVPNGHFEPLSCRTGVTSKVEAVPCCDGLRLGCSCFPIPGVHACGACPARAGECALAVRDGVHGCVARRADRWDDARVGDARHGCEDARVP